MDRLATDEIFNINIVSHLVRQITVRVCLNLFCGERMLLLTKKEKMIRYPLVTG